MKKKKEMYEKSKCRYELFRQALKQFEDEEEESDADGEVDGDAVDDGAVDDVDNVGEVDDVGEVDNVGEVDDVGVGDEINKDKDEDPHKDYGQAVQDTDDEDHCENDYEVVDKSVVSSYNLRNRKKKSWTSMFY